MRSSNNRNHHNDCALTLRTSVHDDLRHHTSQEEPEQAQGEAEVGPVMSILQDLQHITLYIDLASEVLLVESFHGNLGTTKVLLPVLLAVELEVCLNGLAGELGLIVLPGRHAGCDGPEGDQNGDCGQNREEDPCVESSANFAGEVPGNDGEKSKEEGVGEGFATGAIGGKRCVLDGSILYSEC